jgi:FkbM family methyltransferase
VNNPIASQPIKTRALHVFRNLFKLPSLERWLVAQTQGISMDRLIYKIVPHSYTYPHPSFRNFERIGLKLKVDISDFLGHGLYFGYDNEEARSYEQLLRLVKPGYTCVDVGANIGYLSMMMAAREKGVTVIGFEPDPVNFQRASENLSMNRLDSVKIHHLGLGDEKSEAIMEVRASYNLGGNRIGKEGTQGEKVSITTMDLFFEDSPPKINLIKIDVEGYEMKVLLGAEKLLKRDHPVLFVEINDGNLGYHGNSASQLITFLVNLGYTQFENTRTGETVSATMDFKDLHFDLLARA